MLRLNYMLLMLIVPKGLCSVYNIDFSQFCVIYLLEAFFHCGLHLPNTVKMQFLTLWSFSYVTVDLYLSKCISGL